MIILGIESSCDETSAAILKKEGGKIIILSNIIASSASLQEKFGGIIPEQAAREQLKSIIPVIKEALSEAKITWQEIDAIAVTQGPGLIGSLLVGVETAKTLSKIYNKPLIPINHLIGHFYANFINTPNTPNFPCIGLLVSGGHTDLVLFESHGKFKYLGGTRDDAAGECFDKCARLLNLPYPGGPQISKLASTGDPKAFNLPRPMINSNDFDFSFSGLKTAVSNLISNNPNLPNLPNLCASIEQAIIDPLVKKTLKATLQYKVKDIIVAGGVAANPKLKSELQTQIDHQKLEVTLHIPPPILCTDNAAMITSAAFFENTRISPENLQANPNLSLAY